MTWSKVRALLSRPTLTKEQTQSLLVALGCWAEKYNAAKPAHATQREKDLFDACTKVGLMWLPKATSTDEKSHGNQ